MLTDRDNAVISFLDDFEVATTSQLKQLFFSNVSLRYCQVRLNKLVQFKELSRVRTHIDQEYLYCIKEPKQLQHFFLRTTLYFECLKYYKVDQWTNRIQIGPVIPDAYIQLVDHDIIFGLFVEVHRSNNLFNQGKYESLYLSGVWKDHFKSFPRVLIVTDKKVKLAPSKIKYRIINTNFDGLNKLFLKGDWLTFNGKAHIGVGLMVGLMVGVQSPIAGLGIVIGSLLPDCDIKGSLASLFLPLWLFVKHRTYTHSLFACLSLSLLSALININLAGGLFLGYILHLIIDSTTPMRIKYFLWPYKK